MQGYCAKSNYPSNPLMEANKNPSTASTKSHAQKIKSPVSTGFIPHNDSGLLHDRRRINPTLDCAAPVAPILVQDSWLLSSPLAHLLSPGYHTHCVLFLRTNMGLYLH